MCLKGQKVCSDRRNLPHWRPKGRHSDMESLLLMLAYYSDDMRLDGESVVEAAQVLSGAAPEPGSKRTYVGPDI